MVRCQVSNLPSAVGPRSIGVWPIHSDVDVVRAAERIAGGENEGSGGDESEASPGNLTRAEQIASDEFLVAISTQLEGLDAALPARELHAMALCQHRAAVRTEQAALLQGRIDALHATGRRLPL